MTGALVLTFTVAFAVAPQSAGAWDKFAPAEKICGRVTNSKQRDKPIPAMQFNVYRISDRNRDCCDGADLVGNVTTNKHGQLFFKSALKGFYYVVSDEGSPRSVIPIEVTNDYKAASATTR
jgi:hypothetical protein